MKIKTLKCYVITVSKNFPLIHPEKGKPTFFIENILEGIKITTIRKNYPLWEKRIAKVKKGEAYISLRYWEGLPRKSKQLEFKQLFGTDGVGIEKLTFEKNSLCVGETQYYTPKIDIQLLAKNDGLSLTDFKDWFAKYDLSKDMAIIHFTNFRYYAKDTNSNL